MLAAIKAFFNSEVQPTSGDREHQRQLACAALLIEVAVIDDEFDAAELTTMHALLKEKFQLSQQECETLTDLAKKESADATSTYQFTQLVNEFCTAEEKYELVKGMWQIAFADGNLDKYEEYVIRKVSELIYVSHSDFIRAKLAVRQ